MRKPWSISTTVRNPERLRDFLRVLKTLEGRKFDDGTQKKFQIRLIQERQKDLTTLNLNDAENGSCQLKSDLERGIIQKGNKIVAMVGIQMLLNYLRGEKNRTIVLNM